MKIIVEHGRFVIHIPDALTLAEAAPLRCAAVTVYAPLRHWQVRAGSRIGIVGLGGLGHLGVQLAHAVGAEMVVLTTSPDKVADARRFGATDVVVNADPRGMAGYAAKLGFILDTVPYRHDLSALIDLLRRDASLCLIGIGRVSEPNELFVFSTIGRRNSFAGSLIGSIWETQEVVDFCALKGICPSVKVISVKDSMRHGAVLLKIDRVTDMS